MNNDRSFTAYALVLIAGVASVITASVMAGFATLPTPLLFVEHLAMSLGFRAAYKSFGGIDWILGTEPALEAVGSIQPATQPSIALDDEDLKKAA